MLMKSPVAVAGLALLLIAPVHADPVVAVKPVVAQRPAEKETIPGGFRTVESAIAATVKPTAPTSTRTVQIGYLGLHVITRKNQLVVDEIAVESPAETAGLKTGDVVVQVADVRPTQPAEFRAAIQQHNPGDRLTLKIQRDGKPRKIDVTLAATSRPVAPGSSSSRSRQRGVLGVNISTSQMPKGVKITSVFRGSAAEKAGIKVGDVFLKVSGVATPNRSALVRQLSGKKPGDSIVVELSRSDADKKQTKKSIKVTLGGSSSSRGRSSSRRRYWTGPSYRLAIIGVEYPDVKHNKNIRLEDWTNSFFSRKKYDRINATGQVVFGSMNDYFHEISAGRFQVKGKVFPWVTVSKKRSEYSTGTGTSRRQKSAFFNDVLDKLADRDGRDVLKDYDGVVFLYAGGRYRTSRGGLYWPHRSSVSFRGRRMPYFICPEGGTRMQNISVFCHEFGHMLGLPDLYARPENPGSEGASVWCAMSNQSNFGRPQHYSAWCKEKLGWVKPVVIDPRVKQKLVLRPIENSSRECYKVLLRADGSEYYLLENRRRTGFDKSLPASGLLIWRVINGRPFLQESHGETGPRGPYVYRDRVPFPSKSNNAFTPYTVPSSRSQLGGGWPVHLTNIRELPDGRITFYVGYEFD